MKVFEEVGLGPRNNRLDSEVIWIRILIAI